MKRTLCALLMIAACHGAEFKTLGSLESHDPQFDKLVPPGTKIEIIGEGFSWIEGPLWLPSENCLVFSNIPPNKLWKWTEKDGAVPYLEKSGYLGKVPRPGVTGAFDQAGSNGLILSPEGKLVLCQHGLRQMGMMKAPLNAPKADYQALKEELHQAAEDRKAKVQGKMDAAKAKLEAQDIQGFQGHVIVCDKDSRWAIFAVEHIARRLSGAGLVKIAHFSMR